MSDIPTNQTQAAGKPAAALSGGLVKLMAAQKAARDIALKLIKERPQ